MYLRYRLQRTLYPFFPQCLNRPEIPTVYIDTSLPPYNVTYRETSFLLVTLTIYIPLSLCLYYWL